MHNIEKSRFHRGQYAGYANGRVFEIWKSHPKSPYWVARDIRNASAKQLFDKTLAGMSAQLEQLA